MFLRCELQLNLNANNILNKHNKIDKEASTMKASEAKIVKDSWNKFIVPMPDYHKIFGVWLFQNVFRIDPDMIKLFHFAKDHSMTSKELWNNHRMITHVKLVASSIETAVEMYEPEQQDALIANLRDLGKRHAGREVLPIHYDVFAQALLQTVSKIINEYYTGDIKESWEDFVQFLTMTMQEGAEYDALNRATGMHL